ncbi:MAG: hypothetical protein U0175_22595 [Caldilineaceae bacterium]
MADDRLTNVDRESVQNRNLNQPIMTDESRQRQGVHVYDRPASARPAANNMLGLIIALIVILIIAYFIIQWLF